MSIRTSALILWLRRKTLGWGIGQARPICAALPKRVPDKIVICSPKTIVDPSKIRTGWIVGVVALVLVLASAQAAEPWCAVGLDQWSEARTLDACTEAARREGPPQPPPADGRWPAAVPRPPFGRWTETGGALSAIGLANCWSTMLLPGEREGAVVSTRFTVVNSSDADRQLPGGCVRWGFHWGENLPGWDVGVVLGYQDPLNFYRVQLSAVRGELALWDATGGFLQLIPCRVAIGKPHDLRVRWREGHLVAELDGQTVMDYWDRTLPYTRGRVGLAVWKSAVRFERFKAARAGGFGRERMPPHQPQFHFEPARDLLEGHPSFHITPQAGLILFDGNEPISYFCKNPESQVLYHMAIKFKPGWRAAYAYNYLGPQLQLAAPVGSGSTQWPVLVGELPGAFTVSQSGETLKFTFQVESPGGTGHTDHECTVRFAPDRGVYRYEFKSHLYVTKPCKGYDFELSDPHTFNNRAPGPEVVHRWTPAGHRWWVSQGTNDTWQRMPIVDDWGGIIANAPTKWGKSVDFLYPDPAACPACEIEPGWSPSPGQRPCLSQCLWGYDFHHRVGPAGELKAGDERTWTMVFTAIPPKEAELLFARSAIPAVYQERARIPFVPFVPTGNTFAATTTLLDPSTTMCWMGGVRDTTAGHGDSCSLRIDGSGRSRVVLYQYMIEQDARRWQIRGWVKTKDVAGRGVTLRVKYSYGTGNGHPGDRSEEIFDLGGAGTHDWTAFSVVTSVPRVQDSTDITWELEGAGQAWIDDVAISALTDEQQPEVTTTAK